MSDGEMCAVRDGAAKPATIDDLLKAEKVWRRRLFQRIRSGVVAVALGHPDQVASRGKVDTPMRYMFKVVGTAFMIDARGVFVTAAHVTEKMDEAINYAGWKGEQPPERLLVTRHAPTIDPADNRSVHSYDTWRLGSASNYRPADISVITMLDPKLAELGLTPLAISDEFAVEGDAVGTCGFPRGLDLFDHNMLNTSFCTGTIGAVLPSHDAQSHERDYLQIDTALLGGTSGGPLFDLVDGRVVGVVYANSRDEHTINVPGEKTQRITVPHPISRAEDSWGLLDILNHWYREAALRYARGGIDGLPDRQTIMNYAGA